MQKIYKLSIFIAVLSVLGVLAIYFIPSAKKEFLKESEKTQPISLDSSKNSENSQTSDNIQKNPSENSASLPEAKVEKPKSENASESSTEIIQKLVSWGYSKPSSPRRIDTIIIHSSYNALGGDKYDADKLIEEYKSYGVAPHYLIDRSGKIYQLVKDQNIAYHAGVGQMPDGRTSINDFSLGIEMMTTESEKLTESQYQALNWLIGDIKQSFKIKNILGHNQIAPGRKTDPWNFDWSKIKK